VHVGVVAFALAWLLAAAQRRAQRSLKALAAARQEAMAGLADSERRRAKEEQLAAMGRLAGEVAHEVNNPLAVAKSSATYIRPHVASPDEEPRIVCGELMGALDRISDAIRRLRAEVRAGEAKAHDGRAPRAPLDVVQAE
jgi:signal transduction histidine kinase